MDIVKVSILAAIQSFFRAGASCFDCLNTASIILLPKKDSACTISDFRPISLIHGIAKIVAKILSLRLAPKMNELISNCQSAFIKTRFLQDNFILVQNMVRRFHKTKTPMLFIKIDFAKAFDSVSWPYLIRNLQARGFGPRFISWVSSLFRSASPCAL